MAIANKDIKLFVRILQVKKSYDIYWPSMMPLAPSGTKKYERLVTLKNIDEPRRTSSV